MRVPLRVGWIATMALAATVTGLRGQSDDIVAVSSKVSKSYVRHRLPDGSFQPENYVFGEGGMMEGNARDVTAQSMTFLGVAHTIAYPLAQQKYLPGKDPKTNQLLIMVYWGTTRVPVPANESAAYATLQLANQNLQSRLSGRPSGEARFQAGSLAAKNMDLKNPMIASAAYAADASLGLAIAENRITDRQNERNAAILGYDSWWNSTSEDLARGPMALAQRQDVVSELEDERYYVVLMAYDWQALSRKKQHDLMWETRFSIRSRHNDFSQELAAMAQKASHYFGSPSDGLLHLVPEGHVWVGEAKPVADADSNR